MSNKTFHISDEDLLRAADGELSGSRSLQVRTHLEACWTCRARMAEIEESIGEFVRLIRDSGPELPPIDGTRSRLAVRLAELVPAHSNRFRQMRATLNYSAVAFACILLLALATSSLYQRIRKHQGFGQGVAYAAALPNPTLTPGVTQFASLAAICSAEHDQVVLKVPEGVEQEVFREYGIAGAPPGSYEVDFLVTPGLGGSDDIRNLWPEPHNRTIWNSYVKDQLEDHLHYLVCSGQLSLATAQRDIATDWISAYRKYFHTFDPLNESKNQ
jgi:hypothetical protein